MDPSLREDNLVLRANTCIRTGSRIRLLHRDIDID
jgi:hypothetical protein